MTCLRILCRYRSRHKAVVRESLDDFKPAQKYLFASVVRLTNRMSENTVNFALKRMGYDRRLTGHGLRATMSTALNEIGYPRVWVDAQLPHADPNRISAIYNHAQYVEQGRVMMQDWANRLACISCLHPLKASHRLFPYGPIQRGGHHAKHDGNLPDQVVVPGLIKHIAAQPSAKE